MRLTLDNGYCHIRACDTVYSILPGTTPSLPRRAAADEGSAGEAEQRALRACAHTCLQSTQGGKAILPV